MKLINEFLSKAETYDKKGYDIEADMVTAAMLQYVRTAQMQYGIKDGGLVDASGKAIPAYSGGKLPSNQTTSMALDSAELQKFQQRMGPESPPMIITFKDGKRRLFVHSSPTGPDGKKYYTVEPGKQIPEDEWQQFKNEKGWGGLEEITCFGGASNSYNTITNNSKETEVAIDETTGNLLINPT